jgi:hypothetical protein
MVRIILLLLVLGNLAFFAWDRYLRAPVSAEAYIQQVQMAPEKIRLLDPKAARAPVPKSAAAAEEPGSTNAATAANANNATEATVATVTKAAATPCVEWGVFVGLPEAARADAAIAEAGFAPGQARRVLSDVDGHWVLIPPAKSRAEVGKTVENLKELGVTEYTIVPEPPQWRNAVSLGIFRTEDAARNLLAEVRKKGVNDAIVERRERFFQQVVYLVREPSEADVAKLTAMRNRVLGSEVKAVACPAP